MTNNEAIGKGWVEGHGLYIKELLNKWIQIQKMIVSELIFYRFYKKIK